jgi:hypothetical protein
MEPNGIACNALVATCDGVESIGIIFFFLIVNNVVNAEPDFSFAGKVRFF